MTTHPLDPHDDTALVAGEPLAAFVATLRDEAPSVTAPQAAAIAARARLAAGRAPSTGTVATWSRRLGLLAAAALVVVVGVRSGPRDAAPQAAGAASTAPTTSPAVAPLPAVRGTADVPVLAADARAVRLVLDAPDARSVHLVGDFNGWDRAATALEREAGTGRWSVVLPLAPGRYRYAFLVDGATWVADPAHEQVRDADFGTPTSELLVEVRP